MKHLHFLDLCAPYKHRDLAFLALQQKLRAIAQYTTTSSDINTLLIFHTRSSYESRPWTRLWNPAKA